MNCTRICIYVLSIVFTEYVFSILFDEYVFPENVNIYFIVTHYHFCNMRFALHVCMMLAFMFCEIYIYIYDIWTDRQPTPRENKPYFLYLGHNLWRVFDMSALCYENIMCGWSNRLNMQYFSTNLSCWKEHWKRTLLEISKAIFTNAITAHIILTTEKQHDSQCSVQNNP